MITIQKQDGKYCVHHKQQQLGFIELHDNPQHATNCYIKVELHSWETSISEDLWRKVREIARRPLQVMVDSSNMAIIDFLNAGGFVCKRKCYEVDACVADYVGGIVDMELYYCIVGDQDYEACCQMMYHYYLDTHKEINPWTADYDTFCAKLTKTAVYAKTDNTILSLAFIESNEIAYVCSSDQPHFHRFAQSLISSMFTAHNRIIFECDDCDRVAIILKNLFVNQSDTGFCAFVLE